MERPECDSCLRLHIMKTCGGGEGVCGYNRTEKRDSLCGFYKEMLPAPPEEVTLSL